MHANPLQRNRNHIHFEDQSNFSKLHDNVQGATDQLVAFRIKLLNLAQVTKLIKNLIIPYYWHVTRDHPKLDFYDKHMENPKDSQLREILRL
jgi:hypothetical protein